jgi:hypothetical protein
VEQVIDNQSLTASSGKFDIGKDIVFQSIFRRISPKTSMARNILTSSISIFVFSKLH